jgi:hypothetical protein
MTQRIWGWRHDTQLNNILRNDIQHNDTQHNDIYHRKNKIHIT